MRYLFRALVGCGMLFFVLLLGPLWIAVRSGWEGTVSFPEAPTPSRSDQAIVQVYGARAGGWRSCFSLHTWIAFKQSGASPYHVYEVVGDRVRDGLGAVRHTCGDPYRPWCGNIPVLLAALQGEEAERAIPEILRAIDNYPYHRVYRSWPGPNCNTFLAYIGRSVERLHLVLPPNAIGKDFLEGGRFCVAPPSHTGIQISCKGVLGCILSLEEGCEINFLGLNFGFNPHRCTLLFPGVGRIPCLTPIAHTPRQTFLYETPPSISPLG